MQPRQRLPIPVQIRQEQEALSRLSGPAVISNDDVFLLRAALDDVEDPVQASLFAPPLHVRSDVGAVDLGGLCHHAGVLGGIFLDVGVCAGVEEVDLEVRRGDD